MNHIAICVGIKINFSALCAQISNLIPRICSAFLKDSNKMAEGGSKLSEELIYETLKSLNVVVRLNDLKVPTKDFMIRVFDCFLKDLQIDVTGSDLRTWEATKHFEEVEIYEESMYLTLLAMTVNNVISTCGLNITIKDIIEPKPKRTKKILNYLLVFWNYCIQKYARFHEIEKSFDDERKKAESIMIENQSLEERCNAMLNILNSMEPSKEELKSIVAVIEEKVSNLKEESDTIGTDYQVLKTKQANLRNEMNAADIRILTAKQTIEELEQMILSSPDRINTEIQKLEEKIKIEDLKIKEVENKCKEAEKKLKLLEVFKVEEEKDVKALDELTETVNQLEETVKGIVSSNQKIQEEEERFKKVQADIYRQEESKVQHEQKVAKVGLSSRKQIEKLKEVLEMNQKYEQSEIKDIEFLKTAINNMQSSMDSEADDILNVVAKCKEADARSKERKAQYMTKLKEMSGNFKSDCDEVEEAIIKTFPYDLEKKI